MIQIDKELISPDLLQKIKNLDTDVQEFRNSGPLDKVALEKLREHFRTHHIFHSAGIEGNRLTLQETAIVLKEGIDISDKPIQDSIEVKNLGIAFDFLYELAQANVELTESYVRQIHKLIVGSDESLRPGEYRNIGVIITGSDHRPPEPFEVPIKMMELIEWVRENKETNPIIVSAIAHHEFVKIHPFADGNGRTARIILNLLLLKKGYPICNIKRTERPEYYKSLSDADGGNYEPIIDVVASNCNELFAEYIRVRDESLRLTEWAKKIGQKDFQSRLIKAKGEFEIWYNRINQIKLEFKQAVSVLNDNLESYNLTYYEYPSITFEKYQQLEETGVAAGTNVFSIRFHNLDDDKIIATFMFRLYRHSGLFDRTPNVIPMTLNYYDADSKDFVYIHKFAWSKKIKLRSFYISDNNEIIVRYQQTATYEGEIVNPKLSDTVREFFNEIFEHMLGLK
jgi:Fic family protein